MSRDKTNGASIDAPPDADEIDLLELEETEGPIVVLPNRRKVRIHLFDGPHYQIYEKTQRELDPAKAEKHALKLIRFAIPDITIEEIQSLSPLMAHFIGKSAARQAEAMLALLRKNVERPVLPPRALADASKPLRSTRKTKQPTSSRASRGRSEPPAASGP